MKKNIVITVLSLLVLGLLCFIVYDKFINKDEKKYNNTNYNEKEGKVIEQEINTDTVESNTEKTNTKEIRNCVGTYSGTVEGSHSPGEITVELKSSGSYLIEGYKSGEYRIVEDILLLKNHPDVCGTGETCEPSYIVNFISEDCSTIQWLYGSKRFPLTKQN